MTERVASDRRARLVALGAPVGAVDEPLGLDALEALRLGFDVGDLLGLLGRSLRELHDTPVEADLTAPLPDAGVGPLLAEAADRVRRGEVHAERVDAPFRRFDPIRLLRLATEGCPGPPDVATLVHGTARLTTVRIEGDGVTGWTVLGRAGLGDPYRDLATLAIDLASTVGPEALGPLVDAYGLEHHDVVRLDWHVLVDQLLR